jgi:hypothetical protein
VKREEELCMQIKLQEKDDESLGREVMRWTEMLRATS